MGETRALEMCYWVDNGIVTGFNSENDIEIVGVARYISNMRRVNDNNESTEETEYMRNTSTLRSSQRERSSPAWTNEFVKK